MKYYLIAGEASGDLHASNLMKSLKKLDPDAGFRYYGGDLMQAEGGTLVKHHREMAYMGFVEVFLNLFRIFRLIGKTKKDLLGYRPDALILVDFPGFNLRIAAFAKKHGIKTIYYISPKIWAWNRKRIFTIRKIVDKMLVILPFEVDFYRKYDMEVAYVGNPLMDAIDSAPPDPDFLNRHNLEENPLIALLPGSRKQEIERILPEMLGIMSHFPQYRFVIAGAPSFPIEYYQRFLQNRDIPVIFNQTYDLLRHASAALVTSGTATLETALLNVPQVVCYKGHPLSVFIARLVIKVRYISLVNLIMDRELVKELIQKELNEKALKTELERILMNPIWRESQLKGYSELKNKVGLPGASGRAASEIITYLNENR